MKSSGGAIVEAAAITANRALVSDANGIPVATNVTNTELGYVGGVTSAIQSQIDAVVALTFPSGIMLPYGGGSAPTGFLLCDGSAVSRTTYANLFTAIGVTYGAGNGTTTFNLPNTQGIFLRGAGSQTVGGVNYSTTIGTKQGDLMQGHLHGIYDGGHNHSIVDPGHTHVQNRANGVAGGLVSSLASGSYTGSVSDAFSTQSSTTGITINGNTTGVAVLSPTTDGTNGTPRTGLETRPVNLAVNYIIKV